MIFNKETSLVSLGDFIDVYYKIKFKRFAFKGLKLSYKDRVSSKWNAFTSESDFWIIPEIKQYWNKIITDNLETQYEDYVCEKYLKDKKDLSLLAIGCGEGRHERSFAKYGIFKKITGVDISQGSINRAMQNAESNNLNIEYHCEDFRKMDFSNDKFDVVLFDSSLHHFERINDFIKNSVIPILNEGGILVVFEYCGPNRLQWKKTQLNEANKVLNAIPVRFKKRIDNVSVKKKVYRPGLIRMMLVDPSEAPDSQNLVKALHNNLKILEEKKLGWNILHILLKGIAHNFLSEDKESKELIKELIEKENIFLNKTLENDAVFGVYQKR